MEEDIIYSGHGDFQTGRVGDSRIHVGDGQYSLVGHEGRLDGQGIEVVHEESALDVQAVGESKCAREVSGGDACATGNNDLLGEIEVGVGPGGAGGIIFEVEGAVEVAVERPEHFTVVVTCRMIHIHVVQTLFHGLKLFLRLPPPLLIKNK